MLKMQNARHNPFNPLPSKSILWVNSHMCIEPIYSLPLVFCAIQIKMTNGNDNEIGMTIVQLIFHIIDYESIILFLIIVDRKRQKAYYSNSMTHDIYITVSDTY